MSLGERERERERHPHTRPDDLAHGVEAQLQGSGERKREREREREEREREREREKERDKERETKRERQRERERDDLFCDELSLRIAKCKHTNMVSNYKSVMQSSLACTLRPYALVRCTIRPSRHRFAGINGSRLGLPCPRVPFPGPGFPGRSLGLVI